MKYAPSNGIVLSTHVLFFNAFIFFKPHRCLVDSKRSRSKFEPRQISSEIRLSLQAFRFALGQEVYYLSQICSLTDMQYFM